MKKDTFRVVTRGADGQLRIKDYGDKDALLKLHTQIGVDDCNTDLDLRGMPVFRGLIGPMSEDKTVVRYETPDVFEALTKEWSAQPAEKKKRRRRSKPAADKAEAKAEVATTAETATASPAAEPANVVDDSVTRRVDGSQEGGVIPASTPVTETVSTPSIAPMDAPAVDMNSIPDSVS